MHCSAISDCTEPNPPEANSRSGDKPDGYPELVGDRRDIQREFPLLVEPDEVYLCQVGDLQQGDPKAYLTRTAHSITQTHHDSTEEKGMKESAAYPAAGGDGVVHHGLAGERE